MKMGRFKFDFPRVGSSEGSHVGFAPGRRLNDIVPMKIIFSLIGGS